MRRYDPGQPLVFVHVPKTAGTSVRQVFAGWFGDGLILHYHDEVAGRPPGRSPLFDRHSPAAPVCLYGHFNAARGFGVTDAHADATQFVSLLRDPFEAACSAYFYLRRVARKWRDPGAVPPPGLPAWLARTPPNMLAHFPRPVTRDNYRDLIEEFFVEIGVTEQLAESLARIARHLGRPFDPGQLPHRNVTPRQDSGLDLAALRAAYRDRHPLDFAVYDHVRWLFDRQPSILTPSAPADPRSRERAP